MQAFVREALTEGLAGWQVTDCRVTMTDCGYASPATSAADFRRLTLARAHDRVGTRRHLGLRAPREPRPRGPVVDEPRRSGGAGPAGRLDHRPVLDERRVDDR